MGVRGYNRRKIFTIKDARMWVLEHFGDKKQHLYEPGFLTVTFELKKFQYSGYGKCICM
jgi:hypothetical protein